MAHQRERATSFTKPIFSSSFSLSFVQPTWSGWDQKSHRKTYNNRFVYVVRPYNTTVVCCGVSKVDSHLLLKHTDVQCAFIQTSWGVKPVYLPDLLPNFDNPLTPDDIAALSEDPFLHSRIIVTESGSYDCENGPRYTLRLGPFTEGTWETLPTSNWTLLVQGVDRRVPQLRDLLDQFSFIPNWRVDDIQASYATTGGGVGPHVDNYDVFLVQAAGVRKWYVGHTPISPEREVLEPDLDVRVLKGGFKPDAEYMLQPGDVLYVPPRFPHWGISQDDDCITLSVGFRAPSISNLLSGWVEHVADTRCLGDAFYTDDVDDLSDTLNDAGRISKQAANKAFDCLKQVFTDDDRTREEFFNWFTREMSRRKMLSLDDVDVNDELTEDDLEDCMTQVFYSTVDTGESFVCQQMGAVFTYVEDSDNGRCIMYIDGMSWLVEDVKIAKLLCGKRKVDVLQYQSYSKMYDSFVPLVRKLLSTGLLRVEDQDEGVIYS